MPLFGEYIRGYSPAMLFMIIGKDHADSAKLRANTRRSLDYLQSHDVRYAGLFER